MLQKPFCPLHLCISTSRSIQGVKKWTNELVAPGCTLGTLVAPLGGDLISSCPVKIPPDLAKVVKQRFNKEPEVLAVDYSAFKA